MADNRAIGVFDSGLGGLTVVREIIKLLPHEDIIYFGDTGRVPYGSRSKETIIKYTKQDESFLLSHNVKLVVAACGTVSSVAPFTGELLPVPFVEVVSHAAVGAVNATKNGKIGVIGTSATVASNSYKQKITELLPNAEVIQNDCPLFVPLVEEGWIGRDDVVTVETAKRYLEPIKQSGVDTLIMGCTHYPVITDIIRDCMGSGVTLINAGEYTARAIKTLLSERDILSSSKADGKHEYYVSDRTESFSKTASILMGHSICESVQRVDIDHTKVLI